MRHRAQAPAALLAGLSGCLPAPAPEVQPAAPAAPTAVVEPAPPPIVLEEQAPPPAAEPLVTRPGPMTSAEAERHVLALVDRDRADHGLPPLRWDETAARAARRHARDLLAHGVTSHVGTDGSVPEQRYTEAGGRAMVWENVACFGDGVPRRPADAPRLFAEDLAAVEHAFMDEAPPHDGHRRNILGPHHTAIGVGLAAEQRARVVCVVEELVDDHGAYADLPAAAEPGRTVEVAGTLRPPLRVLAVGVSRADPPRPRAPDELRPTRGYVIPSPSVVYQPDGFGTPIPLWTDPAQRTFRIRIPIGRPGEPGLYGVSVWAGFPGSNEPALVSLRTIDAR